MTCLPEWSTSGAPCLAHDNLTRLKTIREKHILLAAPSVTKNIFLKLTTGDGRAAQTCRILAATDGNFFDFATFDLATH